MGTIERRQAKLARKKQKKFLRKVDTTNQLARMSNRSTGNRSPTTERRLLQ